MNKFDDYDNLNNNDNGGYMDYYDTSQNYTESRGQEAINGMLGLLCFSLILPLGISYRNIHDECETH